MTDVGGGAVHDDHPFATPPELRDPTRRLRGRLAAPVTVLTAGQGAHRTGLTVSSLVVAEGRPPLVYALVGPTTDFFYAVADAGRYVLHVATAEHREVADTFAGLRPRPGGLFAGRELTETGHGPLLAGFETYAMCSVTSVRDESYSALVAATID
ncbi:MAG: flavin reductase, partial [Actinobacteria bacterium]|nr:flavin reductase [Actinomycetota bacterium]NIS30309.1 flavin reductase [Actinomycetota bacterium]NIT96421.1 flavin reductase [Actinomycetota bacterium]NIU65535.1 flavin reductase [Actinomycetota bacterium]NIV57086.1 flavin reductase [Actinomycetota bacterium]